MFVSVSIFLNLQIQDMGSSSSNKSLAKRVDSYIEENDVMIFSKTYCPYCTMAKQVFSGK